MNATSASGNIGTGGYTGDGIGDTCDDAGNDVILTRDRNPQVDEGPLGNELLQPGQTLARTRAYHQATSAAGPADSALYNQRRPNSPPPLPTCHASKSLDPATCQEAIDSAYGANWSYAIDQKPSGLQWAGSVGVAFLQRGGDMISTKWAFTQKLHETSEV